MKISTWNTRHCGGSRIDAIKAELDNLRSENLLVIITEFRSNKNGRAIPNHLNSLEFNHQFVTVEDERMNGVLIASKEPFLAPWTTHWGNGQGQAPTSPCF